MKIFIDFRIEFSAKCILRPGTCSPTYTLHHKLLPVPCTFVLPAQVPHFQFLTAGSAVYSRKDKAWFSKGRLNISQVFESGSTPFRTVFHLRSRCYMLLLQGVIKSNRWTRFASENEVDTLISLRII